ncbi:uncharacterized protein LOC113311640 [Papaver somniferum]|uniref:uncharacterized protein LOC113311640 n=1 Tax=Papaver somniferum TaxID=3469 RepID=UPI000E704B18|nr:uncharacterized protein LOC113311640 [Papaver somniferum]
MGDTIDCIDIYKQPSFDHPLLKNHKIQVHGRISPPFTYFLMASDLQSFMKPSYSIRKENMSNMDSSVTKASSEHINELGKEIMCPIGTVPIRRTTKRELIFSNLLRKSKQNHTNDETLRRMYHHYVSVETPLNTCTIYHGVIDSFGIHTPSINPDQYSTSQMWIQNGEAEETNSIEGGWVVYPELFGDHATRFFTHWTADGYRNTAYGTKVLLTVNMDEDTRYWWIYIGDDQREPIGYWPSEIFTYLRAASLIRFGGIAGARTNTPSPPMGTGNLPTKDYKMESTGFTRFLQVVINGDTSYFGNFEVTQKDTSAKCYDIIFRKYGFWERRKYGYNSMIYGGPGGNCI